MLRIASAGDMGSLRRDYVARIPIELDRQSRTLSSGNVPPQFGARVFINGNSSKGGGAPVINNNHPRTDSENPAVVSSQRVGSDEGAYTTMRTDSSGYGTMNTAGSSRVGSSRETGSILKKTDHDDGGATMTSGERTKQTPQNRRRVRFTNNVALYRFDSDGVDSAYSSSDYERLSMEPKDRKAAAALANDRSSKTRVGAGYLSDARFFSDDEYAAGGRRRSSSSGRRNVDRKWPTPVPVETASRASRSPRVLHGTPNGSLFLKNNNLDRATSLPSVEWINNSPSSWRPSSSVQKPASFALVAGGGGASGNEKKLVITTRLRDAVLPNEILVKANKNGSKIRIVPSNAVPQQSSSFASAAATKQTSRHPINEQIHLPFTVDPYRLTARLDHNGSLLIEAPVIA